MLSDVEQDDKVGTREWIASVRPTPAWFIALVVGFHWAMLVVANMCRTTTTSRAVGFLCVGILWCFLGWLRSRRSATGGWRLSTVLLVMLGVWAAMASMFPDRVVLIVEGSLLSPLTRYVPWFLAMGLLWTAVGRLRCRDLGLTASKLCPALCWVVTTWVVSQLVLVAVHSGDITVAGKWRDAPLDPIGYLLTAQLLGNALFEELLYRAFLIVQLTLLFERWKGWSRRAALTNAVIVGTLMFALFHVIGDWSHGESPAEIAQSQVPRLIMGFLFAGIFLLSNNLFIAVGIHALANLQIRYSSPLHAGDSTWVAAVIVLLPLVVLAALALRRRREASAMPGQR